MADMKQFMVLVTPLDRARLDALRIVAGVSRADVVRQFLTRFLAPVEYENAERLLRLTRVAAAAGYASREDFVMALVEMPEYRQKTPSLEDLEEQYLRGDAGTATDLGAPDANSEVTTAEGLADSLLEA